MKAVAFTLALALVGCDDPTTDVQTRTIDNPTSAVDDGAPQDLMTLVVCQASPGIAVEQMPPHVPAAFLAAEDRHFFQRQAQRHGSESRITTMLVKIMPGVEQGCLGGKLTPDTGDKSQRKRREAQLAARLERELTRSQLLSIYLNNVYLGHGTYGVPQAAKTYFGKQVSQLSIAEAALLGGLVASPPKYAPDREPRLALERRNDVLSKMRMDGHISDAELDAALAEPITIVDAR